MLNYLSQLVESMEVDENGTLVLNIGDVLYGSCEMFPIVSGRDDFGRTPKG